MEMIDVADPRLFQEDCWRPYFARLRREEPVHWCAQSPSGPYWSVTSFQDIMPSKTTTRSTRRRPSSAASDRRPAEARTGRAHPLDPPNTTSSARWCAPWPRPTRNLRAAPSASAPRQVLDDLPAQRDVRLGGPGLGRADHHDAGDAVRLPVRGSAQTHLVVGRRHRGRAGARRACALRGPSSCGELTGWPSAWTGCWNARTNEPRGST